MTFEELKKKYTEVNLKIAELESEYLLLKENSYYVNGLYDNIEDMKNELKSELAELYIKQDKLKKKLREVY